MFHAIELGTKLKPIAIERFKASAGHREVVAVVSKSIAAVHMHYTEGIGFYYCFQGQCCSDQGLPQVRYVLPLLVYTVRDLRTRDYGLPLVMKYLPLGRDDYESKFLTKMELDDSLHTKDLLVTCTDEQFQKNTYDVIGPNRWRDPAHGMVDEVKRLWDEYRRLIAMSVARNITPEKYVELLEKAANNKSQKSNVPPERQRVPTPDPMTTSLTLHASSGDGLDLAPATRRIAPAQAAVDLLDDTPVAKATVAAAAPAKSQEVLKVATAPVPPAAQNFDDLLDAPPGAKK